jgi:antitoxin (DNA-binding transcriptional repressor) of toxin-antitoxin stability system
MVGGMAQLHMTEAEAARDFLAVLAPVRAGTEVVVEKDHQPVAVIRAPAAPGRPISECTALARAFEARSGYVPTPDGEFGKDVEAGIEARREPLDLSAWD